MKLSSLLEAPLVDVSYHKGETSDRDYQGSGFSKADLQVILKNIREETYLRKLKKIPFDLYVYFIDDERLNALGSIFPERPIAHGELRKHLDNAREHSKSGSIATKIHGTIALFIGEKILARLDKEPTSVHFVMGDNYSDTHPIAPTPWIVVHRFLHAVAQDTEMLSVKPIENLRSLISKNYRKLVKHLSGKIYYI